MAAAANPAPHSNRRDSTSALATPASRSSRLINANASLIVPNSGIVHRGKLARLVTGYERIDDLIKAVTFEHLIELVQRQV